MTTIYLRPSSPSTTKPEGVLEKYSLANRAMILDSSRSVVECGEYLFTHKKMQFVTVYDDEPLVLKIKDGLPDLPDPPQSLPRYEYNLITPDRDSHIRLVAQRIVDGMKGRRLSVGSRDTCDGLPKHVFPSSLLRSKAGHGTGWKKGRVRVGCLQCAMLVEA